MSTRVGDTIGRHNIDLGKSRSRILEGATWKKQRIVVIIPAGPLIPAPVALALWNLVFPPNQPVFRYLALGLEVGDAYSQAITEILAHPELSTWEYILTVEHDNLPPADGVVKLITRLEQHKELACIGGLYWTKGEAGVPQIWGDPKDPILNYRPQPPAPMDAPYAQQLVECCGTGMGFNLWRVSMFKDEKLRKPWFKTTATAQGASTQDLYAWTDFRKYGYRCAVDCDVKVGHLDQATGIVW